MSFRGLHPLENMVYWMHKYYERCSMEKGETIMQKITFFGDIMIEPPILKAAKRPGGKYDFNPIFAQVKDLLAESDFVVSNLETPMAGKEAEYTKSFYVFNAPDEYADAVKNAGVDLIITANNHVFDRGVEGLKRTVKVLDEKGIPHTGTWADGKDREEAYYFDMNGTKVAVIAYTYGTNWKKGEPLAEGELSGTVNLLRDQKQLTYLKGITPRDTWVDKLTKKWLPSETRGRVRQFFGYYGNWERKDDRLHKEETAPYMAQVQADIKAAKEKADIVIFAPHTGGQFHNDPGEFTKWVVKHGLEAGADAIMASHSHAPQQLEMKGEIPCAWSLGNFSMCPYSSLMVRENMPDYGLAVHMYVEDKKIVKTTFSILKGLQKKGKQLVSWPVDKLYATLTDEKEKAQLEYDVRKTYTIITKTSLEGEVFRKEYEIPEL